MLVDAGRDGRVGELEQQRPRAGAEQQHRLAIEAPGLRSGPEHPDGLGLHIHAGHDIAGVDPQRSSGRRPMSHHAAGRSPAATASLATSQTRNLVMPSATASDHGMPVAAFSHGTPIA